MDVETAKEQALFDAALPMAGAAEREAFLNQACAGDAGLRARVARLLAAHTRSGDFFAESASHMIGADGDFSGAAELLANAAVGEDLIGKRVGRYKLLEQLGEGGCGVVYLAEQEEPVHRRVALKVIKLGMDTKNVIARFDAERQALALMDHPNIAMVLDAGSTETGRPYFVMELVGGVKITSYCDENRLTAHQRLDLFIQVCQAIQHAHQKGVIHRDIKPSNILVALHDGVPVPKVIDFGIAKAIAGRLTHDPAFTLEGQFIGTPAYMSPEQAELSGLDVDTRSDIYSLGVLLYELLTGRPPFDQKELVNSGMDKMRKTLRETEPRRPSVLLTSLANTDLTVTARRRHAEPPRLIKSLKGDLDWIVMKALEKDRQRRYETANAMAMDVRRYLNNEPILARPPSRYYRVKKLVQRNKGVYASGVAVALSLITALGVSTRLFFKEREARVEQAQLRQKAEFARAEAERARANEVQLRQEAEAREKVTQAWVLLDHGETEQADALLDPVPLELFSPSTEATKVFRELGTWNMLQGRWRQAANRYLVLVEVNQVDKDEQGTSVTFDFLTAAPLLIEAGDAPAYDRLRRKALVRLGGTSDPGGAEQLVKISLLLPGDDAIMKRMGPLAQLIADSLKNYQPQENGGWYLASWRALALALWEYRRGNFNQAVDWLEKCSRCPDQSPSCVAAVHILRSMACLQLGRNEQADSELALGRKMVNAYFGKKLEIGDDKAGRLGGWIMNPIFLREADELAKNR